MLTGKLIRVRHARQKLVPAYLDADNPGWLRLAEQLILAYRDAAGRTRGEIEDEIADVIGDGPRSLVPAGLAKLLEELPGQQCNVRGVMFVEAELAAKIDRGADDLLGEIIRPRAMHGHVFQQAIPQIDVRHQDVIEMQRPRQQAVRQQRGAERLGIGKRDLVFLHNLIGRKLQHLDRKSTRLNSSHRT